jgi:glycosyltransferase involved in cell wall biosynthesis
MVPNKRGPVELQTIETARQATERGMHFTAYFARDAPAWFTTEMSNAGGRVGVFDSRRWTAEVVGACARERPDIVHFHFGPHAGMTEAARRGAKVVRTEHSPRPARPTEPLRAPVRHWRTRNVDLFIAVSDYIARQTMRNFAVGRRRVRVVLNATDIERFRPRPEEKQSLRRQLVGLSREHVLITVAANLRPAKRQHLAVVAMHEVLRHAPNARLVLAGDGPERARLETLIRKERLDFAVKVLHEDNDVALLYAASDIALLPSTGEGLPGGAIEALSCGLPLVATPNGGTPEVYEEGISGKSVFDQTSAGVAEALVELIRDPSLREQMGRSARKRAEALFAISRPARETLAVYDELLSTGHKR